MSMTKTVVMGLIAQIDEADLMTDELKEFMITNLVDGGVAQTKSKRKTTTKKDGEPRIKTKHQELASKCLYYIRDEVFKGIVPNKYCLGASQGMAKLLAENEDMPHMEACNIIAKRTNDTKGEIIFPLDKKTFAKMEKEMKERKALPTPSRSNSSAGSVSSKGSLSKSSKKVKEEIEEHEEKPHTVKKIVKKIEKSEAPTPKVSKGKKTPEKPTTSKSKPKPKSDDEEEEEKTDFEDVEDTEVEESSEEEEGSDEDDEKPDWTNTKFGRK